MDINRRHFMLLSGTLAATTTLPIQAGLLGKANSKNIVLTTGLPTDPSFVEGVNANLSVVKLTNTANYSELLSQLVTINDRLLFALMQPADAILLESALRDSSKRKFISQSVKAPEQNNNEWAYALGEQLVRGNQNLTNPLEGGLPLVAITAYL